MRARKRCAHDRLELSEGAACVLRQAWLLRRCILAKRDGLVITHGFGHGIDPMQVTLVVAWRKGKAAPATSASEGQLAVA
ncbi:hypothetical protein ASF96_09205 [Microbacterium sp. Leaf179]|nr:hypothetical protein ASF96_09205 [Microbacterium sp. Leaf179]